MSSGQWNPQLDRDSWRRQATGSQLPPGLTIPPLALASGTAPLGHHCRGRRARLRGGRLGCSSADCFQCCRPLQKRCNSKYFDSILHLHRRESHNQARHPAAACGSAWESLGEAAPGFGRGAPGGGHEVCKTSWDGRFARTLNRNLNPFKLAICACVCVSETTSKQSVGSIWGARVNQ